MMGERQQFLSKSDVARLANRSPETIRADAISGKLRIAATTVRGERLFLLEDVQRYLQKRWSAVGESI